MSNQQQTPLCSEQNAALAKQLSKTTITSIILTLVIVTQCIWTTWRLDKVENSNSYTRRVVYELSDKFNIELFPRTGITPKYRE